MSCRTLVIDRVLAAALLVACLLSLAPLAPAIESGAPRTRADVNCELGIFHALAGEVDQAESLFVAVLSASPRDGRALTNLGNIALVRGDYELALVFYDRAVLADTLDGGIRLDRAIALALLGQETESQSEVRAGVRLAGSSTIAGSLLGLRGEADSTESRGASGSGLTREEVRALLRASLQNLPRDSTRTTIPGRPRPESPRRIAGPRAEDMGEAGLHLYWKR